MNNIQEITVNNFGVEDVYVVIDRGNDEFTSMPKSVYDTLASESAPTA